MAPYQAGKKAKTSSSCDIDQKRFKCECNYCRGYVGNTSGILTGRKAISHSSSWDKLIQEFNNLTPNPGSIQPLILQERLQDERRAENRGSRKSKGCFRDF